MNAKTAEALEKSIEHWRENCAAPMGSIKIGPPHCALCRMFHSIFEAIREDCKGCPVRNATGVRFCKTTPYDRAEDAHDAWEGYNDEENESSMRTAESAFRVAAREELAFLESLREPTDRAALDAAKE